MRHEFENKTPDLRNSKIESRTNFINRHTFSVDQSCLNLRNDICLIYNARNNDASSVFKLQYFDTSLYPSIHNSEIIKGNIVLRRSFVW